MDVPNVRMIVRRNIYVLMLMAYSPLIVPAQTQINREYQIKAGFLFNFTQFVEWPASSFESTNAPFIIGILGENPFGSYLAETVSGENVNGHPLIIQYYTNLEEIKTCHILFIAPSRISRPEQVVTHLKGRTILTVSEAPSFMPDGGMIRFFTKNNKIQLQINPEAPKAVGLVISAKLLKLAEIFNREKK